MNLKLSLIPYVKVTSKCIMDLNVKHETIKLLEENIRENLWDPGLGKKFLDLTLKHNS